MKHYYEDIYGWFDYQDVITEAINKAKDGDLFVEIGIWMGKSAAFTGVEIYNSGKKIRYDAIDSFLGSPEHGDVSAFLYDECEKNLKPLLDNQTVNLIKGISPEISSDYEDESIDYCFIDGDHRYESVKKDIEAWFPKVKKGGMICGHDYYGIDHHAHGEWPGVFKAVDEKFGYKNVKNVLNSWIYYK